jgi:hypothetical protein
MAIADLSHVTYQRMMARPGHGKTALTGGPAQAAKLLSGREGA